MALTVAHACIIANYQAVYQTLELFPTRPLLREAEQQPSAFYADDLKRRAELHGGFIETTQDDIWEEDTMAETMRLFDTRLTEVATTDDIRIYSTGPFNGEDTPDVGTVLLNVCAPTSVKSGHTAVPVGEVYTTAGPPLEMPLDIDADLQCRVYLKSALFCNNRPWICRSSAEENI
ncbi:hypothetical protein PENDEC_c004G02952 [Penicillium decumbens]|uniref:Uncharacterized protein n=1 Tax=Penicillium decumbens TaxID=69771 RepID=A0A1V6PIK3_PENDC|nr:hypothetical protein PENDEC_c004G02952 [Penicillium decumbens]